MPPKEAPTMQTLNIWAQMSYVPPRGPCGYKSSMISGACPCLRFMIHPVKAATSFECDGCSHHASFHKMDNKEEDEIQNRWRITELLDDDLEDSAEPSHKKRKTTKRIAANERLQIEPAEENGVSVVGSRKRKGMVGSFLSG